MPSSSPSPRPALFFSPKSQICPPPPFEVNPIPSHLIIVESSSSTPSPMSVLPTPPLTIHQLPLTSSLTLPIPSATATSIMRSIPLLNLLLHNSNNLNPMLRPFPPLNPTAALAQLNLLTTVIAMMITSAPSPPSPRLAANSRLMRVSIAPGRATQSVERELVVLLLAGRAAGAAVVWRGRRRGIGGLFLAPRPPPPPRSVALAFRVSALVAVV